MALTLNKVVVTTGIKWTPTSGDGFTFTGSENYTQAVGSGQFRTQNVSTTTSTLDLGDVKGDKYLGVKNVDSSATVYVDQVTPVVPSAAPHALKPNGQMCVRTTVDTWYAIASTGTPEILIGAVTGPGS